MTTLVRLARTNHFRQRMTLNSNNSSKAWGVLREMLGNKPGDSKVGLLKSDKGSLIYDHDIAQHFNDYFSRIGETLSRTFHDCNAFRSYLDDDHNALSFNLRTITLEELNSVLRTMKTNTAGADDLPMYVDTKNFTVLGGITLEICNRSFCQGKFPSEFKTAKVIPIHEAGDKAVVGNFRPISLIPAFAKIFEKVVSSQVH